MTVEKIYNPYALSIRLLHVLRYTEAHILLYSLFLRDHIVVVLARDQTLGSTLYSLSSIQLNVYPMQSMHTGFRYAIHHNRVQGTDRKQSLRQQSSDNRVQSALHLLNTSPSRTPMQCTAKSAECCIVNKKNDLFLVPTAVVNCSRCEFDLFKARPF